jgi:predicted dinucleotide-binding enzyme
VAVPRRGRSALSRSATSSFSLSRTHQRRTGRQPVRDALNGKIIVGLTNPFAPDFTGLLTPDDSSAAQEIAQAAPAGASVVKAFNTIFGAVLAAGPTEGRPLDVFIAGDDVQAKASVSAFIESLGLRPLDTGGLGMAGRLEEAGLLMMGLGRHGVKHYNFSLGVTILG